MAAVFTVTSEKRVGDVLEKRYTLTSHTDGTCSGVVSLQGILCDVVTNPSATAPTDDWDFVLNDADGVDVLGGLGADRDTATSERINLLLPSSTVGPVLCSGDYTLSATNMGSGKIADVVLRLRP